MNNNSKLLAAVLVFAFASTAFPAVAAQSTVSFGSQVKLGDNDFLPTFTVAGGVALAAANPAVAADTIKEINLGTGGIADSCFYYSLGAVAAIAKFDVRLTPCQGKAAGTQVTDADTVEKTAPIVAAIPVGGAVGIKYADLNSNGRYDMGDAVYLSSCAVACVAGFPASTGTTVWTIRLTAYGSYAAGTVVKPGDTDQTAYGAVAPVIAAANVNFFDADLSGGLNAGDAVYLNPVATAIGAAVPVYAIRLANGPLAFGTQVKLGDSDFKPVAFGANVALVASAAVAAGDSVKEINLGTGGIADSCFYYQPVPGLLIVKGDIRLTPCNGKAAGTQVTDADSVEKTAALVIARVTPLVVVYADINSNGRYDQGDSVYLTTAAAGFAASTGTTVWTIRLTPYGSFAAGTLVKPGDADQTAYGAVAPAAPANGVSFFDVDLSGTPNLGDAYYLAFAATGAGFRFPVYALRLANGPAAYGTQLKFGDSDFLPTSATAGVAPVGGAIAAQTIKEINLGTGGIADSCFYSGPAAAAGAILKFDIRLTPCQGKAAGTMVTDSDTVEKTAAGVVSGFTSIVFADLNSNGRYDNGDSVYLTTAVAPGFVASTGVGAWTIRLTPYGSFAAGTLVKPGDADQTAYGAVAPAFPAGAKINFFDTDLSGTLNAGDVAYLTQGAVAAGAGFSVYSVRLAGTALVASNGGSTVTGTGSSSSSASSSSSSSASSSSSSSSSMSSSSSSSSSGTATVNPGQSSTSTATPGLELVALVGALGAALVLVRRKL
jgi:hypothetical protein